MLIDVHTHVSPEHFPEAPGEAIRSRWPCMRCGEHGRQALHLGDTPFRELDARSWNAGRRLEDMDRDGVAIQVLSPMPELLSYWMSATDAAILCDHSNAWIAEMVALHPERFRGLGAVPVQDARRGIAGLERLKSEFGLSGVEIGSNIDGVELGDPMFEDFFAEAERLGLAVFVHALHPLVAKVTKMTAHQMALVGFPIDVALAVASLVLNGTVERHPRLRIGFSHGGGAIGAMLGRLDEGWLRTGGFGGKLSERPSAQARRLFFDSNVYDQAYLRHLTDRVAPGQVFLGTDYPYPILQERPADYLGALGLPPEETRSLEQGAARLFLDMPAM